MRPWRAASGGWEVTVGTWSSAGAVLDGLARQLDVFLTAEGFPVDYFESDHDFG